MSGAIMDSSEPPTNESQDYALRFEDLTVNDDLPLLDRIVRYCRSGIALQRLVHVKMLAETAETVGCVQQCRRQASSLRSSNAI
jgi:serine/threonine-protein phosphatase 4 regulatory subunit 1